MTDNLPPLPAKKGLSGLAIAGIGCLGLVVVICIGGALLLAKGCSKVQEMAADYQKNPVTSAAKLIVALNPDLQFIKADEGTKEITIKDKKSGQVMTMSLDDLQQGKFKVTDDKGNETSIDTSAAGKGRVVMKGADGETVIGGDAGEEKLPSWIPPYPGSTPKAGGLRVEKDNKLSGLSILESADSVSKVKEFYESKFKTIGFKVDTTVTNTGDGDTASVSAKSNDGMQTVGAVITTADGKTSIMLNYEGPK